MKYLDDVKPKLLAASEPKEFRRQQPLEIEYLGGSSGKRKIRDVELVCDASRMRARALVSLINGYMEEFGADERQAVDYWRRLPLHSVLSRAGRGEDHHGQRHPHLRRLTKEALAEARSRLFAAEERLSRCRSFHEIWELVGDLTCDVYGYGDMAQYDTAVAIGAHLSLLPDRIYLHQGTRVGAERLGIAQRGQAWVEVDQVPAPFRDRLEPYLIESFLCVQADLLRPLDTAGRAVSLSWRTHPLTMGRCVAATHSPASANTSDRSRINCGHGEPDAW